MQYLVRVSNTIKDIEEKYTVTADSVFDAIDIVADMVENPEESELIEAIPIE